jgi:short-subunit dehydrogenase
MHTLDGKRVLITGAAAGIGRSMARRFAGQGAHLLLTDIDEAHLTEVGDELLAAGYQARAYPLDVSDCDQVRALVDVVHADGGQIDVLVNNAGVVFGGAFLDVPIEAHLTTLRVNALGPVMLTHAFLPDLISRQDSHLVNVASAAGYLPVPLITTYAASKWATLGFSESIQAELVALGHRHVHVTTVCPGYVSTGMFDGPRLRCCRRADCRPDRRQGRRCGAAQPDPRARAVHGQDDPRPQRAATRGGFRRALAVARAHHEYAHMARPNQPRGLPGGESRAEGHGSLTVDGDIAWGADDPQCGA